MIGYRIPTLFKIYGGLSFAAEQREPPVTAREGPRHTLRRNFIAHRVGRLAGLPSSIHRGAAIPGALRCQAGTARRHKGCAAPSHGVRGADASDAKEGVQVTLGVAAKGCTVDFGFFLGVSSPLTTIIS